MKDSSTRNRRHQGFTLSGPEELAGSGGHVVFPSLSKRRTRNSKRRRAGSVSRYRRVQSVGT